jgi:signal transduction histidine kinase
MLEKKMAASDELDHVQEQSKRLRRMLLLVFGGLLTLMVVAGLESFRSLQRLEALEQQVNQQFAAHSDALMTIVISVHFYNNQIERYLMPGEAAEISPLAEDVERSGAEARAALQRYPEDRDTQEQELVGQIAAHLAQQENLFVRVSSWRMEERTRNAQQFLTNEMLPHRTYILQASREMASLNDHRLNEANLALADSYTRLRSRVVAMLTVSLAAGLLLSLIGGLYILRLERQGRRRYEALVESRRQLEDLSAGMVEAQEAERRTISRELHDEVGQTLGALLLDVGQVARLVSPNDQIVQGQIARIKSAAESAVKSIRDMALLLRPPMLDDLGLIPALEWHAREVSRRSNLEVTVDSENVSEQLPDEVKVCVYRLVQEALNNAAIHSGAKSAKVTAVRKGDQISLRVEDDGRGFDPSRTRGMGLLGMEERVRRLNGTFTVESGIGKGTRVTAKLALGSTRQV